jgi:REP element-mobilizing transposase RayT
MYLDEEDREVFLSVVGKVCVRFNWLVYAYCLMDNHQHLLVETPPRKYGQVNAATQRGLHPAI